MEEKRKEERKEGGRRRRSSVNRFLQDLDDAGTLTEDSPASRTRKSELMVCAIQTTPSEVSSKFSTGCPWQGKTDERKGRGQSDYTMSVCSVPRTSAVTLCPSLTSSLTRSVCTARPMETSLPESLEH